MERHWTLSDVLMVRSRAVTGLTLEEPAYPAGFRAPKHVHEPAYFAFFLEGGCTEVRTRETEELCPLTLIFHPPGNVHSFDVSRAGLRTLNVQMEPAWLDRIREHADLPDTTQSFRGGPFPWLASRFYTEFRASDPASSLTIEALAIEILAEVARRSTNVASLRAPRRLRQAKELLHDRFAEPLSLDDIAASVGVHPVHLARVFRQRYGCTVGEYLRHLRIDFACAALTTSDTPIGVIALAAGFADQSHFTKTFRRATDFSPAEYRRIRSGR
jgi:AraC family transcriptional regulator